MRSIVLSLAIVAICAAVVFASSTDGDINPTNIDAYMADVRKFESFVSKFNKQYESNEMYTYRFDVFRSNVANAEKLNKKNGSPAFGITKFSDLTPMEFKRMYLTYRPPVGQALIDKRNHTVTQPSHVVKGKAAAQPTSDWRKKGAITPVKDQGQCGSCWAFSVTQEVESAWFLSGQSLPVLAPQQVVSCDTKGADQGCNGGDSVEAYKYLATVGMEGEKDYPYVSGGTGSNGDCTFDATKTVTKPIAGWTYATPACTDDCTKQDEATLAANIAEHGPASICVAADTWQSYTGGIIRDGCASAYSSLDHCVHLVGLETKGADTYWLVKNSWADSWGEQGYIYLAYGSNLCGLADEATFVHF